MSSGFLTASASALVPPPPDIAFEEETLWAGDLVADVKPLRLCTVLGSCVAVCLHDPARHCGGMNHFLIPRGGDTPKHGEWATFSLIQQMLELGSSLASLEAKVFGGGTPLNCPNERHSIGLANVQAARRVLAEHGIPIVAEKVGHGSGMRMYFETWSGVVWLKSHARM
jgi:chemotaxis protein CheD